MWIYIVLTDTGTMFTRLIKCFTRRPLNHASISFSKDLEETYSFGRKCPNNPFIAGFVQEDLHCELFRNATCAIYRCRVSDDAFKQMKLHLEQFKLQKQKYKYNLLGLFGVILNKELQRKNAFFCSQFVATILQNGGIRISNKPASLVKPCDIADSDASQLVYAGQLYTYLLRQQSNISQSRKHLHKTNYYSSLTNGCEIA